MQATPCGHSGPQKGPARQGGSPIPVGPRGEAARPLPPGQQEKAVAPGCCTPAMRSPSPSPGQANLWVLSQPQCPIASAPHISTPLSQEEPRAWWASPSTCRPAHTQPCQDTGRKGWLPHGLVSRVQSPAWCGGLSTFPKCFARLAGSGAAPSAPGAAQQVEDVADFPAGGAGALYSPCLALLVPSPPSAPCCSPARQPSPKNVQRAPPANIHSSKTPAPSPQEWTGW